MILVQEQDPLTCHAITTCPRTATSHKPTLSAIRSCPAPPHPAPYTFSLHLSQLLLCRDEVWYLSYQPRACSYSARPCGDCLSGNGESLSAKSGIQGAPKYIATAISTRGKETVQQQQARARHDPQNPDRHNPGTCLANRLIGLNSHLSIPRAA